LIRATEIFWLNELGKRANNEDCISPQKGTATLNDRLFMVCDGVGGEKKGEVASEIVCQSIQTYVSQLQVVAGREKEAIQQGIHYANEQLAAYAKKDPEAKRMSTTLALVFLGEQSVVVAWCGDTRVHHIRKGEIRWRSKDHSLVAELVSQGELTEEEARKHPRRNVITRSLNALNYNNIVDFHEVRDFESGDYILLCSDGFLERINDQLIYDVLVDEKKKDKAASFFSLCNGATRDNFSMYLIRGYRSGKPGEKGGNIKMVLLLLFMFLLIAVVLFLFFR
jgi:PPM family protein phosphatase